MRRNLILFDLDGTLTDPFEGITKSMQHALRHFGIHEDNADNLKRFIGPPLRTVFLEYGVPLPQCEEAVAVFRERFGTVGLYENVLYDGVVPLLAFLKEKGYILAIASSKAEFYVKKIAEHFKIAAYFAFIGGAEMDGRRSEKADVIRYVMASLGAGGADRAYMVGDREHDILSAQKAGIISIGVLYGYGGAQELTAAGASHIIESVAGLIEFFGKPK